MTKALQLYSLYFIDVPSCTKGVDLPQKWTNFAAYIINYENKK